MYLFLLRIEINSLCKCTKLNKATMPNEKTFLDPKLEGWMLVCMFCWQKMNEMECPYFLENRKSANKLPNICDQLIELKCSRMKLKLSTFPMFVTVKIFALCFGKRCYFLRFVFWSGSVDFQALVWVSVKTKLKQIET